MKRLVGSTLVMAPLLLAGCGGLDGLLPFGTAAHEAQRLTGQWQKTVIVVQKYRNALFRDLKTGKLVEPDDAKDRPTSEVGIEAGDFEELAYRAGRLRYAAFGRGAAEQPYVVERQLAEKDFETLDAAFYKDKFFGLEETNWDKAVRFPLFFVQYDQGGKGWKSSFTPNLNKLLTTSKLVNGYFGEMSGEEPLGKGQAQTVYYLASKDGRLSVSIATQAVDANGDLTDTAWKLESASYDLGQGFQTATVEADGTTLSLPLAGGDGSFKLMGLKVATDGDPGAWETLLPVRLVK